MKDVERLQDKCSDHIFLPPPSPQRLRHEPQAKLRQSSRRELARVGQTSCPKIREKVLRDSRLKWKVLGISTGLREPSLGKTGSLSRSKPVQKLSEDLAKPSYLPAKTDPYEGIHKPFLLIFASAHLLGTVCQVSNGNPWEVTPADVFVDPLWLPTGLGAGLGVFFAALNRFGLRRFWRESSTPLNVVITGSTRGIGKALARELLKKGDAVMVTSSNPANVRQAMKELRAEVGGKAALYGLECNVSSPGAVTRLANAAASQMGSIDVWINNAGYSGRYQDFTECTSEQLQNIVQTNLVGSLLCARGAWRVMRSQATGGHIFNIDGAGADGSPTPQYAAYGATKAGIAHLMGSLNEEIDAEGSPVGVHTLSPGMVLTPLLLEGATDRNKAIFNILCEQPETVAAFLTPRIRSISARGGGGRYIRFLTLPTALLRFLTAPLASKRFFGRQGQTLYLDERERIMSPSQAKITKRLTQRAARRNRELAVAYSLSLAMSYIILVADSHKLIPQLPFT